MITAHASQSQKPALVQNRPYSAPARLQRSSDGRMVQINVANRPRPAQRWIPYQAHLQQMPQPKFRVIRWGGSAHLRFLAALAACAAEAVTWTMVQFGIVPLAMSIGVTSATAAPHPAQSYTNTCSEKRWSASNPAPCTNSPVCMQCTKPFQAGLRHSLFSLSPTGGAVLAALSCSFGGWRGVPLHDTANRWRGRCAPWASAPGEAS